MPATPQPFATTSGGPVAPVSARLRDYALLSGACGGAVGACSAASFDTPIAYGFCWVGATWAAAAAAFVGVRHALLQDRWEEDREGVSGVAGAVVGGAGAAVRLGRGVALQGAGAGFALGFVGHFAHRLWLRRRLDALELPNQGPLFQSIPPEWADKAEANKARPQGPQR